MGYANEIRKIMPTTYFTILLVLTIVSGLFLDMEKIVYLPYTYAGILLITFGIIMNIWADFLFKNRSTTVKPHERPTSLVVTGPFRISRHPMYLGMFSVLLGCSLVFGKILSFLFPVVFFVLMQIFFVGMEEENLVKAFGREYVEYKEKVRSWF